MDRERLLESLYRFRDFLTAVGNNQIDLWPLANAIRWIAAEPEPGTTTLLDGVRMCAGWLTEAGHGELADVILAANRATPAPPPPDSVPVRIAVAINAKGFWYAFGEKTADDDDAIKQAINNIRSVGMNVVMVTAAIPPYRVPVIAGTVEATI